MDRALLAAQVRSGTRVIDPQHRLGEFIGRLTTTTTEMPAADAALRALLALD